MFWIQIFIHGILVGGIYALIAVGFSLVWGVMNIINLTHGGFIMLGAYITFSLYDYWGLDPFLSLPISFMITFIIGYLTQMEIINRIVKAPIFMTLILTFGINLLLINIATLIWTANFRVVNPSYAKLSFALGPIQLPMVKMIVFVIALSISFLLEMLLDRTVLGRAIRATRMSIDSAKLMGISVRHIYGITFGIGVALAGVGGSLVSLIYPITTVMGPFYLGIAFVACALGGLGDIRGALVGGLLFGVMESLAVAVFGVSYQAAIVFVLLLLILLLLPRGIIGREYY
jgi:branched-chain amino acid transport system permease protein